MSTAISSPTGSTTIDTLLTTKKSAWINFKNAITFIRTLLTIRPKEAVLWTVGNIIIGACTPLEIWAAGNVIGDIADQIQGQPATPWIWVSLFVFLMTLERILDPICGWAEQVIRQRGFSTLQEQIYRQTTEVDLPAMEHQSFYDTTRRIIDEMPDTSTYMLANATQVLRQGPSLIGSTFLLLTIDWTFVVALVIPMLPTLWSFFKAGVDIWDVISDKTRDRRIARYIATQMTARGPAKEIRLFGLKDFLLDRFSHHFLIARDELRKKQFLISLKLQVAGGLAGVVSIALFAWLAIAMADQLAPQQITVLMITLMSFNVFQLQMSLMSLGKQGALATDFNAYMSLPAPWKTSNTVPMTDSQPGNLASKSITFAYPGSDSPVIDNVSIDIPAGQRIAIVGENGAGKTTLIKLLLGLYQPDSGTVTLDGHDLGTIPTNLRQQRMAAVFQHFARLPLSWHDNITLNQPGNESRLRAVEIMSGSDQTASNLPNGESTVLSPDLDGVDLSGGQWQRLAIARAGYRNADILALDEPTAALDPMAEVDIFQRFTKLAEGKTTLLVSHRLGMCRLADRIVVLENGHIIEDGNHDELVAARGRYAELWEMQARWYR